MSSYTASILARAKGHEDRSERAFQMARGKRYVPQWLLKRLDECRHEALELRRFIQEVHAGDEARCVT